MMKPTVIVNTSQLKYAFKSHYNTFNANQTTVSGQLLLFYAVEVGLKLLYLEKNKLRSTKDFVNKMPSKPYGHGHKITLWVDELKISARAIFIYTDNPNDPIENYHEKLRYGAMLTSQYERRQLLYLKAIASHIKQKV